MHADTDWMRVPLIRVGVEFPVILNVAGRLRLRSGTLPVCGVGGKGSVNSESLGTHALGRKALQFA